ncbi:hypothetical protein EGH22_19230 [Halomicroarcula sp. F28]|uniref:hypothetical protein n=1 Tax=Haloarcula salinisoli TaxID=2487746 RepID=UPI001C72E7AC|nr:hypothetical protein [Halomicroarcula salinisoli]MBX0288468.1 hypothetical protein [Halomicroarcula salinisoli]
MHRRELLGGLGSVCTIAVAGCTGNDDTDTATGTETPTELQSPSTTGESDSTFEREFLRDAFEVALSRNGISVRDMTTDGDAIILRYNSLAESQDPENKNSIYSELLTIAGALHNELLVEDYGLSTLQVYVVIPGSGAVEGVYDIDPQWVRDWADGKLTDAQFLTYIQNTKQTV